MTARVGPSVLPLLPSPVGRSPSRPRLRSRAGPGLPARQTAPGRVRARGLWACHLGPELAGKGYGQLKLALMSEEFGMSRFGPLVFGAQAPDTDNSESRLRDDV